ncbi:hypothetical protein Dda_5227 [Drechslerella dactyloides]|uniref:Serine hydrolase domain-containing protein n=1 Tax=Drechslerella dactyloides TaxID=74499 RepID=A0AAD6IVT6_DREDA|nr:hypothetical protein Dda_5227 [Drechslerella dactyloides]
MSALNILMLHGKTQSGALFYAKTRALEKHLSKICAPTRLAFHYPTAPHRLYLRDIPDVDPSLLQSDDDSDGMYTWWRKDEVTGEYKGIDETWKFLSDYMDKNGPFIGAIGFSQGAGLAAILASALEPGRQAQKPSNFAAAIASAHPPLRFAVAYCGFKAPNEEYRWLYEPRIQTPVLNVLGSLDTVVDEKLMKGLVDVCEGNRVLWHPGGHYVVVKKQWLDAVGVFVRDAVNGSGQADASSSQPEAEERVEDMDVPF